MHWMQLVTRLQLSVKVLRLVLQLWFLWLCMVVSSTMQVFNLELLFLWLSRSYFLDCYLELCYLISFLPSLSNLWAKLPSEWLLKCVISWGKILVFLLANHSQITMLVLLFLLMPLSSKWSYLVSWYILIYLGYTFSLGHWIRFRTKNDRRLHPRSNCFGCHARNLSCQYRRSLG